MSEKRTFSPCTDRKLQIDVSPSRQLQAKRYISELPVLMSDYSGLVYVGNHPGVF